MEASWDGEVELLESRTWGRPILGKEAMKTEYGQMTKGFGCLWEEFWTYFTFKQSFQLVSRSGSGENIWKTHKRTDASRFTPRCTVYNVSLAPHGAQGSLYLQCPSAPFPAGTPPHTLKEAQHRAEVLKTLLTKLLCQGQESTTTGMSATLVSSGFHFLKIFVNSTENKTYFIFTWTSFDGQECDCFSCVVLWPLQRWGKEAESAWATCQRLQSDLSSRVGTGVQEASSLQSPHFTSPLQHTPILEPCIHLHGLAHPHVDQPHSQPTSSLSPASNTSLPPEHLNLESLRAPKMQHIFFFQPPACVPTSSEMLALTTASPTTPTPNSITKRCWHTVQFLSLSPVHSLPSHCQAPVQESHLPRKPDWALNSVMVPSHSCPEHPACCSHHSERCPYTGLFCLLSNPGKLRLLLQPTGRPLPCPHALEAVWVTCVSPQHPIGAGLPGVPQLELWR